MIANAESRFMHHQLRALHYRGILADLRRTMREDKEAFGDSYDEEPSIHEPRPEPDSPEPDSDEETNAEDLHLRSEEFNDRGGFIRILPRHIALRYGARPPTQFQADTDKPESHTPKSDSDHAASSSAQPTKQQPDFRRPRPSGMHGFSGVHVFRPLQPEDRHVGCTCLYCVSTVEEDAKCGMTGNEEDVLYMRDVPSNQGRRYFHHAGKTPPRARE